MTFRLEPMNTLIAKIIPWVPGTANRRHEAYGLTHSAFARAARSVLAVALASITLESGSEQTISTFPLSLDSPPLRQRHNQKGPSGRPPTGRAERGRP